MTKPSTPAVWASGKAFGFQPSAAQQAQGFDYIATVRPATGAPITDDHDWPLNKITEGLKWVMDQLPEGGVQSLLTALLPKRSFTANDFIRIPDVPGGLIIQWGIFTSSAGGNAVNFPIQYPNSLIRVYATAGAGSCTVGVGAGTNTTVTLWVYDSASKAPVGGVNTQFLSIGF